MTTKMSHGKSFAKSVVAIVIVTISVFSVVHFTNKWLEKIVGQGYIDDTLRVAVQSGDAINVLKAIDGGANPNCITHLSTRESVLQLARRMKRSDIVDILLKRGATR